MKKYTLTLCSLLLVLVIGSGCSQAQVDRALANAKEAQVWVERAERATAEAEALAALLHNEKATAAVAAAREGLALAQGASAQALAAAEAAVRAQAAGGGIVNILLAIGGTLLPVGGAFLVAMQSGKNWKQAAVQTISGLQNVRKANPEGWDAVAKHLAASQDESVKTKIKAITG